MENLHGNMHAFVLWVVNHSFTKQYSEATDRFLDHIETEN